METVRFRDIRPYDVVGHFGMTAHRLQGPEASSAEDMSVGISHFLPAGGAEMSASTVERIYVVLAGEITVRTKEHCATLTRLDSCVIPAGESRSVENRTAEPATMLVISPQAS